MRNQIKVLYELRERSGEHARERANEAEAS